MTRLFQDGQVAAVDDLEATCAGGDYQMAEVRVQFRCATGQIEDFDFGAGSDKGDQRVDGFPGHLFLALRARIDVTVQAALVAAVAEVNLQNFDGSPMQCREVCLYEEGQGGVHCCCLSGCLHKLGRIRRAFPYSLNLPRDLAPNSASDYVEVHVFMDRHGL